MTPRVDWLLLLSAMLGNFLAGLSGRIFMISLPSVAHGLGTDILGISWALISFQLASMSLSIVFGRLGDIYGRGTTYSLGFILLTASSFLCGISQNILQLTLFRFFQGVGGAMIQSSGRALAMEAVPEGSEGKAQGMMTAAFHSGFLVGPSLGGLIIEYISWRGIFFLLVPVGLAGIALTSRRVKSALTRAVADRRSSVDYAGAALLILLMVTLTLLLDRRAAAVMGIQRRDLLAVAFAGTLWGFVAHERRSVSPMVNFSLFRIRMFSCSIFSLLMVSLTNGLVTFILPFYLQEVLHLSPSFIGVMFLTPPLFTITLSTLSGHITDRIGPRIPATGGVLFSLAALVMGTTLRVESHWGLPIVILALTGLGAAFFNSPNHAAIIGSVPKEHRGFATGMIYTMFGLGNLLGVSLGGFLLAVAFQRYTGVPGAAPTPAHPAAFVSSMNSVYRAAIGLVLLAMMTSLMRGGARIQPAHSGAPGA